MAVSNFTLLAETKRTNRPSFSHAAPPEQALALYNMFCEELNTFVSTKRGIFGEHMHIETNLDGPVTIVIDTKIHDTTHGFFLALQFARLRLITLRQFLLKPFEIIHLIVFVCNFLDWPCIELNHCRWIHNCSQVKIPYCFFWKSI